MCPSGDSQDAATLSSSLYTDSVISIDLTMASNRSVRIQAVAPTGKCMTCYIQLSLRDLHPPQVRVRGHWADGQPRDNSQNVQCSSLVWFGEQGGPDCLYSILN